ncbi:DUF4132 domain-containing protein [Nocardia crassostreae]|uniref:DUF4132 domain-containing protein n=1 Tax=Nocardia crassostreae TaxID=53428 RepID=UPI00082BEB55|nr:DUF4132 domain-containing protein [Nocardia crassostreae]
MTESEHDPATREELPGAEDLFEPTAAQRKQLLYRRDGLLRAPAPAVDAAAVAAQAGACLEFYEQAVERLHKRAPRPDRVLPETPGAVGELPLEVTAALLSTRMDWPRGLPLEQQRRAVADIGALLDHWTAVRGVTFAVEAMVRAMTAPLSTRPPYWHRGEYGPVRTALGVLRNRIAALPEAAMPDIVALLESVRGDSRHARVVTSFVLPSQREWVAADIEEAAADGNAHAHCRPLVDAASTVAQLRRLNVATVRLTPDEGVALSHGDSAITVVDGVGFGVVPVFTDWFDHWEMNQPLRKAIAQDLAVIPTDAAFTALAARAYRTEAVPPIREAAKLFPRRALELLDAGKPEHADLLREHIAGHLEFARTRQDELPAATATLIADEVRRAEAAANEAESEPELLRNPPWTIRARAKAAVVEGLEPPEGIHCAWLPGERQRWHALVDPARYPELERTLDRINPKSVTEFELGALVLAGPDRTRSLVRDARLSWFWGPSREMLAATAAFEADAFPLVRDAIRHQPREVTEALLPYVGAEVVDLQLARLDRRTMREGAVRYLRRHARFTAQVLIPRAVGRRERNRRLAIRTLRLLHGLGHGEEILGAAREYRSRAAEAVVTLLDADPLTLLPNRIPAVPAWVNPAVLPVVRTRDGGRLSPAALHNLLVMLMLAETGEPYAGVAQVYKLCRPGDLGALVWELYAQWLRSGVPAQHDWVYEALGSLGDDDTVAALLEHVRRNSSDRRSVTALDAFVAIGSDAALLAVKLISEEVKTKRVRDGARERIEAVSDRLGLTADQLADRLVPDLGLRADGTLELDFGPRRFVVGFDEQLRPVLTTDGGKVVKTLPKAGAHDDAGLAEQAHKTFRQLKKNARVIAADQTTRLERAMATNRRFTVAELRTLFIAHPLRWHVTRRLVWGVYEGDALVSSFRIAEDRTFADSADETVTVADDAVLGIAHPVQFRGEAAIWSELFDDYELLQPFPQLGREIYTVPAELLHTGRITDDGTKVGSTRFLGLPGRGWLPLEYTDREHLFVFEKPLPRGGFLEVTTDPGLLAWDPNANGDQTFEARLTGSRFDADRDLTFADLDAVTASEILRDIAWLKAESR